MTNVDWDEIKRLAADLQRAQLSSTTQRLAERNCVEIVSSLIQRKLLDVIFTTDGKEYITPKHLTTEIQNELYANGGRINLTDLASILNVDLTHIKNQIPSLLGLNAGISEVLGQLIDNTYKKRLAEEINVKLEELGQLSVGDLAHSYDLPPDFLKQLVEKNLGRVIKGKQDKRDPQIFFTEAFLSRNTASIRGALIALTRPTPISNVLSKCCIQESLFFTLLGSLTESKEIPGVVTGNKNAAGVYVPTLYARSQTEWVNSFYKQNGFLEYDALARLGISDGRTFVKKHFPNEKLLILQSAAVGPALLEQVEAAVEEAIATGKYVDVVTLLPTVIDTEDAQEILQEVIKNLKCAGTTHVFCGTIVLTEAFMQTIAKPFDKIIQEKAEQSVSSGAFLAWQLEQTQGSSGGGGVGRQEEETVSKVDKRDERRKKAAGGKSGGGAQGRETKTKSTKKKQRGRGGNDSDDEVVDSRRNERNQLELVSKEDIEAVLANDESIAECEEDNDLVGQLSEHFHPLLNKKAIALALQIVESNVANSAGERRKTHSELQDKFNAQYTNIKLLEKGIRQFPNTPTAGSKESTQALLVKYLLKSLCTEMVNEIFGYVAQERMLQWDPAKEVTTEARNKLAQEVGGPVKETLVRLNKTLNGTSIEDFLAAVEPAVGTDICDMVIRRPDKKKERMLVFGHRQVLLEQLTSTDDPALALHLTTLILFQSVTQCMLHASGKFVSPILDFLKPHLPQESFKILREYHDLVLKQFASSNPGSGDAGTDSESIKADLTNRMPSIKEIASTFKKSSTASTEN